MAKTLANMTEQELRNLVGEAVEEKLLELLADPDEGAQILPALRTRLVAQQREVANGQRGRGFDEVEVLQICSKPSREPGRAQHGERS